MRQDCDEDDDHASRYGCISPNAAPPPSCCLSAAPRASRAHGPDLQVEAIECKLGHLSRLRRFDVVDLVDTQLQAVVAEQDLMHSADGFYGGIYSSRVDGEAEARGVGMCASEGRRSSRTRKERGRLHGM